MARRKKILCVFSPSPAVGELAKLLKEAGFSVVTAHSFRSALLGLYSENPDGVLLDRKFAILDGLSSVGIIEGVLPRAVVIVLSTNDPNIPNVLQTLMDKLRRADAGTSET